MFQKGERISKYEIRQELGGGYFGTTYRAFDTITQTDVALKIISNLKHFNFESFAREARMLFELNHPNIIKYFESNFFTFRGRKIYYISMEYAQRGTLREVMNTFDVDKSIDVTLQMLKGLEAIHSKGILHSDLKPDNILLDLNKTIKISDFGVAKMGVGTHYFGSPAGSPLYMAPEQFLKGKTSVRTDIWSVGVVLYEMIYKRRPFENIQEIIDKNYVPHFENGDDKNRKLNEFIRKCLQRDEENRFQNIAGMITFFHENILEPVETEIMAPMELQIEEGLKAAEYYNKGVEMSQNGDFIMAIAYYTEAVNADENMENAFLNRGLAYLERKDYEKAVADFTRALELKPDIGEAYLGRGDAKYGYGDYDQAIDDYNEALMYLPQDPEVYYNRGLAYDQSGEIELAIADFSEAINILPEFAQAYHNRAVCQEKKKDFPAAIADYTEALIHRTGFSDAYFGRGNTFYQMGDPDRAISDYTQTIVLKPDDADAYYNRAYAYEDKGEAERAIEDYSSAIKIRPDFKQAYINRARLLDQIGKKEEAKKDLEKAKV